MRLSTLLLVCVFGIAIFFGLSSTAIAILSHDFALFFPEPVIMFLFGVGLIGLSGLGRRMLLK